MRRVLEVVAGVGVVVAWLAVAVTVDLAVQQSERLRQPRAAEAPVAIQVPAAGASAPLVARPA